MLDILLTSIALANRIEKAKVGTSRHKLLTSKSQNGTIRASFRNFIGENDRSEEGKEAGELCQNI